MIKSERKRIKKYSFQVMKLVMDINLIQVLKITGKAQCPGKGRSFISVP